MNVPMFVLIAWLALSALVQFWRGAIGQTRTYTMADGIGGVLEVAIAIWLVTVVAR